MAQRWGGWAGIRKSPENPPNARESLSRPNQQQEGAGPEPVSRRHLPPTCNSILASASGPRERNNARRLLTPRLMSSRKWSPPQRQLSVP